jgi:hypothetical protein
MENQLAALEWIATIAEIVNVAHRPAVQSIGAVVQVRFEEPALPMCRELDLSFQWIERWQKKTLTGEWQQLARKNQEPGEYLWALKEDL